jgi:hypothetical protein
LYSIYNKNMSEDTNNQPFSSFEDTPQENQDNNVAGVRHVGTTKFMIPNKKHKNKLLIYIPVILVFLILGYFGVTFVMNRLQESGPPIIGGPDDNGTIVDDRTVMHPLTGVMYTEEDSEAWKDHRPIGIMINNHVEARPQWGLGKADLVYEIVAEGGITRYLAFFQTELPEKIGPVRSTREYYLVLVKELGDAMIMHIGWSPQALTAIQTWPVRSLTRGGAQFDRDQDRLGQGIPTEHTAYVNGPYLRELGDSLGWDGAREYKVYEFKEDSPVEMKDPQEFVDEGTVPASLPDITIDFWYPGDYTARFRYNPDNNTYFKFTGYDLNDSPIKTIDANNDEQVEIKNLIVQFVTESPIIGDDKSRLEYELVGSGEGLVFMDGGVTNVTWTKSGRDERTVFYDQDGREVQFNRGKFWISIVPDRNVEQVVY